MPTVVRVCLVGQDPEKKAQLVPVKKLNNTTPTDLIKLTATKLHVKIKKLKKGDQSWRLITVKNGEDIQTSQDIAALEAMEYLVLVRPGEDYKDPFGASSKDANTTQKITPQTTTSDINAGTVVLPKEIWPLIWSFVPMQLEDYQMLQLSTVSKEWSRKIPTKFLPVHQQKDIYGIGKGDTVRYVGLGQWFWFSQNAQTNTRGRGGWVRYSEETRLLLEDAFGKGADCAVVDIREAQDVHQKKGNKKPRKMLKRMDFQTMEQQNPSGKGRALKIRRLPLVGCGVEWISPTIP